MKPTRPAVLLSGFAVGALAAYLLLHFTYSSLPDLPGGTVITVAIIALVELGLAWTTRNRLLGKGNAKPIAPMLMARFAVLARASSMVGAVLGGAWTGALIYLASRRGDLTAVSHDRRLAVIGIVTGLALVGVALWLEWICRVHGDDDEEGRGHERREAA